MLDLVIANKLYSSWSMRPWMVMHAFEIEFREIVVPLRQADSKSRLARYSPSGKVPVLIDGELAIWESLAIIEYLAENYPEKNIWPRNRELRAHARAMSNEMHGGFMPLRAGCPMNLGAKFKTPEISDGMQANLDRIESIWTEARTKHAHGGPYLFGTFSAADAMFAPVASRLDTYQLPIKPETRAYVNTVLSHPSFVAWKSAALKEPWIIEDYGAGHTAVETYR